MSRIGRAVVALAALAVVLSFASPVAAAPAADSLERALSLAAEGRYPEARRVLDPLLESEAAAPRARLLHGILRVQEGSRREAIGVFSGLAREFPDMFEAHNNLAVLYADEGRLEDARAVLAAILERRPEAVGYRNLGDIYMQLASRAYVQSRALRGSGTVEGDDGRAPGAGLLEPGDAAGSAPETAAAPARTSDGEPPPAAGGSVSADAAADAATCLATAEFGDRGAVEEARRWLESNGAEAARVSSGTRERIEDYRVYLPPFESRGSARSKLRELQEKGVGDIAVVLSGDLNNAVSLGIYAREANATRRTAQLEALGYAPVLEPNNVAVEEYATIEARIAGGVAALSAAWSARFPDRPLREVDCD